MAEANNGIMNEFMYILYMHIKIMFKWQIKPNNGSSFGVVFIGNSIVQLNRNPFDTPLQYIRRDSMNIPCWVRMSASGKSFAMLIWSEMLCSLNSALHSIRMQEQPFQICIHIYTTFTKDIPGTTHRCIIPLGNVFCKMMSNYIIHVQQPTICIYLIGNKANFE